MSQSEPARVPEREDTRGDGPMTGGAREVLMHFLELYRETVLLKVAGLDAQQLCERSAAPSTMSPIGLVRHLTEVEAYWVREVLSGDQDVPDYYATRENPDGEFNLVTPESAMADLAAYEREIAVSREILEGWADLESLARGQRRGNPVNLGWILAHLVEEYARHLGHMDVLRERIDGRTGY